MVSGASLVARRLSAQQGAAGHSVLVLAASDRGPAYRTVSGGVEVHRLRAWHNPFRRGQRFVVHPGPVLEAALQSFAPDVVHLHDPLAMGLPALLAARRLGLPVVLTLHALPDMLGAYVPAALRLPLTTLAWQYARGFAAQCQALVAPSAATAAAVQQHTGRLPQVISNGVDLENFTPQPPHPAERAALCRQYGLAEDVPVVITVGRLDADKQVNLIVQAMAQVTRETPAQLLIVGDGTQRARLAELAAQLGLAGRVHFAGFVSPAGDLPGLYRLADVFAIASEIETEGMVVVEAAASGLPIVAVRATSLPGLVDHERTGWLVQPGDAADMAARLGQALCQPAQARALGSAGRDKMAAAYAFAAAAGAYEQVYARVRAEGAAARAATSARMRSTLS
jgi:1,2-diacylglycerol 3-alpha-glucosyltransferase